MQKRILSLLLAFTVVIGVLPGTTSSILAQAPPDGGLVYKGEVTQEEKEAAAERFKALFFSVPAQNLGFASLQTKGVPGPAPNHVLGTDGLPIPHFFGPYPNYALSPLPAITRDGVTGNITNVQGGIRKFIDALPGLGPTKANDLGQYIPIAVPDRATFAGSDYYEIAVVEVEEKLHTDLPATRLRLYVQLSTSVVPGDEVPLLSPEGPAILKGDGTPAIGVDSPHYLGPLIIAEKDTPVRIKFYNLLPTGAAGDLFIPVDTTVMGAGMGPVMDAGTGQMVDYTQNRATLHLHGGHTPWISDGTPHQWITPANETTPYPEGVSVYNVPDMWYLNGEPVPEGTAGATTDPGDGSMTFYYSNQQSARFMFYHDHAMGITRLNVYAGEAAGYLVTDAVEQGLIDASIIPSEQIPLVIQDKTFIPDTVPFTNVFGDYANQMAFYDPTWDTTRWGNFGDLWYPHVYMPVQNPDDPSGINAFGRWHYGPWFWPPVAPQNPPVNNPYYDPVNAPWEPRLNPGVPSDSMGMESFFDTPLVNGTVYPFLEVDPKSYRFRILNGSNDRFFNLQLHEADPAVVTFDGRTNTEVKMVPADATSNLPDGWAPDGRVGGLPDPALVGPPMVQIGTEGGFLPKPVVLQNHPISWNTDPTTFTAGIVNGGNLIIAPAERADVIIDFSAYAGKTLILYNDAPAPFPALAPQYDYYTGAPDLTDTGSSPGTIPGWGPNTRTIMQIRVADIAPAANYNLAALNEAFTPANGSDGVFARGQDPVFVGQTAYNDVYHTTFPNTAPNWGAANIQDFYLDFTKPDGTLVQDVHMEPKAIQDEMGEAFDTEYGRMSGNLGLEMPSTIAGAQNFMLYPFIGPPVDLIPIGNTFDGFQIWRITHNGVDTHPIHFHLYEVQLLNRVGWDGALYWPDANELGWKETVRISPLQDTIVALKPKVPTFPFDIPNSVRLLDPTQPEGAAIVGPPGGFLDTLGNPVTVTNHVVNFGWEYVWHCHILSHEEMDMMHIFGVGLPPLAASTLAVAMNGTTAGLTWLDESVNESHWTIQRGPANTGPWQTVATIASTTGPATGATVSYSDASITAAGDYFYKILATNTFGDTVNYGAGTAGFPSYSLTSADSNIVSAGAVVPAITTVLLTGLTTGAPLTLNNVGVVQANRQLVGPNFTVDIAAGTTLLNAAGLPLGALTFNAAPNPPATAPNILPITSLEFLPNGATFNPGITLTYTYNPAQLPAGVQEQTLQLTLWNGTAFVQVAGQVLDTNANTITAQLQHFTTYALTGSPASVALEQGWNTLSTPVKLAPAYDTWTELAQASGLNFEAAYQWNGTAFEWIPSTQIVKPLDAYYVKANAAANISFVPFTGVSAPSSKSLSAGWNYIGAGFFNTMPSNSALTSAYFGPASSWGYSQVLSPTFNQLGWSFVRDAANPPVMRMGEGYWLFMVNPATLAGFTSTP